MEKSRKNLPVGYLLNNHLLTYFTFSSWHLGISSDWWLRLLSTWKVAWKICLPLACQEKNVSNLRDLESKFLPVAMIPRLQTRVRRGFALIGKGGIASRWDEIVLKGTDLMFIYRKNYLLWKGSPCRLIDSAFCTCHTVRAVFFKRQNKGVNRVWPWWP